MGSDIARPRQRRRAGLAFLLVGIVFLTAGASASQTTFLTLGPSMVAIGIALIAAARRRPA